MRRSRCRYYIPRSYNQTTRRRLFSQFRTGGCGLSPRGKFALEFRVSDDREGEIARRISVPSVAVLRAVAIKVRPDYSRLKHTVKLETRVDALRDIRARRRNRYFPEAEIPS